LISRRITILILLGICLVALTLGVLLASSSNQSHIANPPAGNAVGVAIQGQCHSANGLPDAICTPGVADQRVTQDNIQATICVRGYTKTVRPPAAYTNSLKQQQITEYGYSDTNVADYEEDHLIPLELGGHPTDPKNLWPQPRTGVHPASEKDRVENALHARVCSGLVSLAAAQAAIARNWESAEGG
jgi:hypothetical protein